MQLSIVIVSYNVKYFLEQCLHSVRRAARGLAVEVIVVDNASTDGSMAYLQPRFTDVIFFPQKENEGFARACNLGLQHASGEYILFLNPDTILAEDTLQTCIQLFENSPLAGAVGVRMIDGTGAYLKESKRGKPGPLTSFFKLSGLANLAPRSPIFARYYLGHLPENQNHEVDVLAGAFMMIPKNVLQQVGAFDEAFFMYGEDIDLSYRIQSAGFKNFYLAQTTIVHFKGESTRRASLAYVRRFYGAMGIFVKKHYHGLGAFFLRGALQAAIYASASLSLAGKILKKRTGSAPQPTATDQLIFVAGSSAQHQKISDTLTEKGKCLLVKNLAEAAALPRGHKLVLCEGTYTFKDLIFFLQQHRGAFRYRFSAAGSNSIAGSDSSNTNGEAVELKG